MIKVSKPKYQYRVCQSCHSRKSVLELLFRNDNTGTEIALCSDCRRVLAQKIDGPARLLTQEDFANNPDVDEGGYLPAWVEYEDAEREKTLALLDVVITDGWVAAGLENLDDLHVRYWNKRPTPEQMEATPWP